MYCSKHVTYRRRLPHKHYYGATFSLTWRLYGSLPKATVSRLKAKRDKEIEDLKFLRLTPWQMLEHKAFIEAEYYLAMDDLLDRIQSGPMWLKDPELAGIVIDQLRKYDGIYYQLDTYCVMSNHVHALLDFAIQMPDNENYFDARRYVNVDQVMKLVKGASSYLSNQVLGRKGPYWEPECWDRYIRNERHYWNARNYFMENPVKARICKKREDFPFSWERGL